MGGSFRCASVRSISQGFSCKCLTRTLRALFNVTHGNIPTSDCPKSSFMQCGQMLDCFLSHQQITIVHAHVSGTAERVAVS